MHELITTFELNDPFTLMAISFFVVVIAIIWYGAFKINKLIKRQTLQSSSTLKSFQMAKRKEEIRQLELIKNLQNIIDKLSMSKSFTVKLHDKEE